jgi:hypothetical protein
MTEEKRIKRYIVMALAVWALALAGTLFVEAQAGGNHNDYIECYQCVTNHTTEVTEVNEVSNWSLTGSLSDADINDIVASTLAGGSHQFDWVTTRWQLSITFATSTSDWDEDTNFSFAIGKRFGKDHWMPNALWHVGYTPDIYDDNDYVHGGATVPLGGASQ